MAFHNPDPKIREIERDNARLRAEFFAELFGGAWRVFRGRPHKVLNIYNEISVPYPPKSTQSAKKT